MKNKFNKLLLVNFIFLIGCSSSYTKNIDLSKNNISLYRKTTDATINHSMKIVTSSDPESFLDLKKDAWVLEDVILYKFNNSNSGELTTIKTKSKIKIIQESNSWYHIIYKDFNGYLMKDKITFDNPTRGDSAKPVISEVIQNVIQITNRPANDLYPENGEIIATIKISSLNFYKEIYYGSSQENIDKYDICLSSNHQFGAKMTSILGGHNFKSLGSLQYVKIGDIINVHSYYGDFNYRVTRSEFGTTDGNNIYDISNNPIIDRYSFDKRIAIYTCHSSDPSGRWIVIAEQI